MLFETHYHSMLTRTRSHRRIKLNKKSKSFHSGRIKSCSTSGRKSTYDPWGSNNTNGNTNSINIKSDQNGTWSPMIVIDPLSSHFSLGLSETSHKLSHRIATHGNTKQNCANCDWGISNNRSRWMAPRPKILQLSKLQWISSKRIHPRKNRRMATCHQHCGPRPTTRH